MAALAQKLLRSFLSSLSYIWTVILALLYIGSPNSFPYRETSAAVPSFVDLDLERGSLNKRSRGELVSIHFCSGQGNNYLLRHIGANLMPVPSTLLGSSSQPTSREVVHESRSGQDFQVEQFTPSPNFHASPSSSTLMRARHDPVGRPDSRQLVFPSMSHQPVSPKKSTGEPEHDLNYFAGDMSMDPFLDVKSIAPLTVDAPLSKEAFDPERDFLSATLPLRTSTPPKSRNQRRAQVDMDVFWTEPASSPPSFTESKSAVGIASARRHRTPALRRSTISGTFDTPPPAWTTPTKPAPSIVVLDSTPPKSLQAPIFEPITPLRIVKRNPPHKKHASTTSDISKAVIAAVREALAEIREESDKAANADPRDVLNRASVLTLEARSIYGADEIEEGYREFTDQTLATPPPPYSNRNTDTFKADAIKAFLEINRISIPSYGSTELGYLVASPGSAATSVESCLDELLSSFEQLMNTLPKFQTREKRNPASKVSPSSKEELVAVENC
ncbi:hypothetical protein H0H93_001038 [Arthromyces matolae]|nr:hypothetical protein H0H93_001038 [Arthromyces matolae]